MSHYVGRRIGLLCCCILQSPWDLEELGATAGTGVPQGLVGVQEAKLDQGLLHLESLGQSK